MIFKQCFLQYYVFFLFQASVSQQANANSLNKTFI